MVGKKDGVAEPGGSSGDPKKNGLQIQPFLLPEGFSACLCLLPRFPAPSSPNMAHSPVYYSSLFPPTPS